MPIAMCAINFAINLKIHLQLHFGLVLCFFAAEIEVGRHEN
jgi:hypothetical protein